jgi:hypothetical protein
LGYRRGRLRLKLRRWSFCQRRHRS